MVDVSGFDPNFDQRAAIAKKQAFNRQKTTLTPSQHDALDYLCAVRHEMHSKQRGFYLSDDPHHNNFELYIGKNGDGVLNQVLASVGLPLLHYNKDIFKVLEGHEFDRMEFKSDYEFEMYKAQFYDKSKEIIEELNTRIEGYLKKVDREHGTHYCPVGKYRVETKKDVDRVTREYAAQEVMIEGGRRQRTYHTALPADPTKKPRIFIDMEGTLSVFKKVESEEMLLEKGYFRNLEPQENVLEAVKKLIRDDKIEVFILSPVLKSSLVCMTEKMDWLKEYLPELDKMHMIFYAAGTDKTELLPGGLRENDYLLDDYTQNLYDFLPARGIKLLNGINHTNGTWRGDRVSAGRTPTSIASKLENIVLNGGHVFDVYKEASPDDLKMNDIISMVTKCTDMYTKLLNENPHAAAVLQQNLSFTGIQIQNDGRILVEYTPLKDYPYKTNLLDALQSAVDTAERIPKMEQAKNTEPVKRPDKKPDKKLNDDFGGR